MNTNPPAIVRASTPLAELAVQIRAEHTAAVASVRKGVEHARSAGELLSRAKSLCPHGEWLPWLAKNVPDVGARQAQKYMRIAAKWAELAAGANANSGAHLAINNALAVLAESGTADDRINASDEKANVPSPLKEDRLPPAVEQILKTGVGAVGMLPGDWDQLNVPGFLPSIVVEIVPDGRDRPAVFISTCIGSERSVSANAVFIEYAGGTLTYQGISKRVAQILAWVPGLEPSDENPWINRRCWPNVWRDTGEPVEEPDVAKILAEIQAE